jgi:hypothetical protein
MTKLLAKSGWWPETLFWRRASFHTHLRINSQTFLHTKPCLNKHVWAHFQHLDRMCAFLSTLFEPFVPLKIIDFFTASVSCSRENCTHSAYISYQFHAIFNVSLFFALATWELHVRGQKQSVNITVFNKSLTSAFHMFNELHSLEFDS